MLTVSQAVDALRQQGYLTHFRLDENRLTCPAGTFTTDEFDIVEVYRAQKNETDTQDMIVYAICSSLKGILITRCDPASQPVASILATKPRLV